jgi:thioredoxin 2
MPEDRLNQKPICGKCHEPLVISQQKITAFEVTDNTFSREVLTSETSVLVDCWAPWCAPCRTLSPIIDELASDYANGVKVVKLNVDENPLTASQYGIRNIPTMLFFKEGKIVQKLTGALPKEEIEKYLLSIINTN